MVLVLAVLPALVSAQDDKAKNAKEDEFAVTKKKETKFTEVVTTDSLPASELLKRAVNFIKVENQHYKKTSGSTSGSKAEFIAMFPVKPKELNPQVDYTGKITMKVIIECKSSKYRYVVSDIRHLSKSGRTTAGSIDNDIPECGSMTMTDMVWKKLRAEALHNASLIVNDIKFGMNQLVPGGAQEEDW
jgi:hypothetical protein